MYWAVPAEGYPVRSLWATNSRAKSLRLRMPPVQPPGTRNRAGTNVPLRALASGTNATLVLCKFWRKPS